MRASSKLLVDDPPLNMRLHSALKLLPGAAPLLARLGLGTPWMVGASTGQLACAPVHVPLPAAPITRCNSLRIMRVCSNLHNKLHSAEFPPCFHQQQGKDGCKLNTQKKDDEHLTVEVKGAHPVEPALLTCMQNSLQQGSQQAPETEKAAEGDTEMSTAESKQEQRASDSRSLTFDLITQYA